MTPPSRTSLRRRGFTLAEALIVLFIIALLAAIIIPILRRRSGVGPNAAAAAEVAALLRHGRMTARLSGRTHVVRLAPDGDRCIAMLYEVDDVGDEQPLTGVMDPRPVHAAALTDLDGSPSPVDPVVSFGPSGPSEPHVLELTTREGDVFRIEVTYPSGLVRLTAADGGATTATTTEISDYWEAQCRHALP